MLRLKVNESISQTDMVLKINEIVEYINTLNKSGISLESSIAKNNLPAPTGKAIESLETDPRSNTPKEIESIPENLNTRLQRLTQNNSNQIQHPKVEDTGKGFGRKANYEVGHWD